ncbi:MAG: FecR family protein [Agriterribacter sp.]
MKHQQDIAALFRKYLANQCSPEETLELIDFIRSGENPELIQSLLDRSLNQDAVDHLLYKAQADRVFAKLDLSDNGEQYPVFKKSSKPLYLKIAAAIAIVLTGAAFFYFFKSTSTGSNAAVATVQDILPGGNKATLVLSDGQQVELNNQQVGNIAEDAGAIISKSADGQLAYQTSGNNALKGFNTVKTPRGGQYQVILPDGSKVWLNAASSVTYPAVFNQEERRVTLTGEGYFEINTIVRNHKKVPFIVETGKQKIEVLGTRFNVNAYDDDAGIKTTLIEGKVKVVTENETVILRPSQEFNLRAEGISTKKVDVEPSIDWKNGDFIFADESIKSIMPKIARWYNVELVYDSDIPNENLSGQISRSRNLSEVLRMLELSGDTKFRIENGAVHISHNKK